MHMNENEKLEKSIVLAEGVKLLFSICSHMIPDRELVKEILTYADKKVDIIDAMQPIMGATGMNYEVARLNASISAKRANAVYNLLVVLADTEQEAVEFAKKETLKKRAIAEISKKLDL